MSFLYILTLWAKLGAEPANKAITFPKNTFFHYAVILLNLFHSQNCNLVDLKGKIEIESHFWKPENHTLKPDWLKN